MLAEADGDAAVMMEGGSVSELLVRLINLDVANAIPRLLTGDRQLPVRCMVTHLKGVDGDFKVQTLVLDTGKAVVTGTGGVDFVNEGARSEARVQIQRLQPRRAARADQRQRHVQGPESRA